MKTIILMIATVILLAFVLCSTSCKAQNQPPVARAGADRSIPLSWNYWPTIYGTTSTDADGWIKSFRWEYVSGPSQYTIVSPTSGSTQIINMVGGVYTFRLTVTDNLNATGTDLIQITMVDDLPKPPPPDTTVKDSVGRGDEIFVPQPDTTVVADPIPAVPLPPNLLRLETVVGIVEYINTTGQTIRAQAKRVEEVWYSPTHKVEYRVNRAIIIDSSGKVIDVLKYYQFIPQKYWQ